MSELTMKMPDPIIDPATKGLDILGKGTDVFGAYAVESNVKGQVLDVNAGVPGFDRPYPEKFALIYRIIQFTEGVREFLAACKEFESSS